MPLSRRKFLIATAILYTTAYSSLALSCMGFSFYFTEILPSDFVFGSRDARNVDNFLDKKYGEGKWEYSSGTLQIHTPDIAENPAVIPVVIRSTAEKTGLYGGIAVFVERSVAVLDSDKFDPTYLPSVYHVDGEKWETKNHPNALQIHKITSSLSMMAFVAEFKLGDHTLPEISTRLRTLGAKEFRVIAGFIPVDPVQKIAVIKQEKTIKTYDCMNVIYVDGKWPEGLKKSYEYQ